MNTHDLTRFLDSGVSSYHAAREIAAALEQAGFHRLEPHESWQIGAGDAVYMDAGGSVVAARLGSASPADAGVRIVAAHTDSPGLQIKHEAAQISDGTLLVPVEVYGGPILATWTDRELSIAGRVVYRDETGLVRTALVADRRPSAIVPNLAIHLNREVNEGISYNRQEHLKAMVGLVGPNEAAGNLSGRDVLRDYIAASVGTTSSQILDMELSLVPYAPASKIESTRGSHGGSLIVSPRIDNLAGCYSALHAILPGNSAEVRHTRLAVFFNHEEIGSATGVGAAGTLLESFLRRLVETTSSSRSADAYYRTIARSVLLSNDAAHARHPNYPDKHDPAFAPLLGNGPVVKKSAIWRYLGDVEIAGWFASLAADAGVSIQYLQNRSDIRAGSTIGPHVATRLGVRGIDIGIPMLAMHSSRETAAADDVEAMATVLGAALEDHNEIPYAHSSREI